MAAPMQRRQHGDKFWFKYVLSASAASVAETGNTVKFKKYFCIFTPGYFGHICPSVAYFRVMSIN